MLSDRRGVRMRRLFTFSNATSLVDGFSTLVVDLLCQTLNIARIIRKLIFNTIVHSVPLKIVLSIQSCTFYVVVHI